jgi:hypothetical protein
MVRRKLTEEAMKEKRHACNGVPLLPCSTDSMPLSSPEPLPIVLVEPLRFSYERLRITFFFH